MATGMNYMMMKPAVIIGNGPSRKDIDLDSIEASTFGCNAIYRDHSKIDFIVAIDDGMIKELHENCDCSHTTLIVPPEDECWESADYNPLARRRSNAGMNAMIEAIKRGHNALYCLGFDFMLEDQEASANMYKGSKNYGPETASVEEDVYNRLKYFDWFANEHPKVKFIMVIPDDSRVKQMHSPNIVAMRKSIFKDKAK